MATKKKSTKTKSTKDAPLKSLSDIPPEVASDAAPATDAPAEQGEGETPTRLKQTEIPGTERPRIKELDEAGELYVDLRDKMQTAVKKFKKQGKTPLIQLMHKHADTIGRNGDGEMVYSYSDMSIALKPAGEKLQVKHTDAEDEAISVGEAPEDDTEGV